MKIYCKVQIYFKNHSNNCLKYLIIYWICSNCTITTPYEKFHFYDFIKKPMGDVTYLNEYECVKNNNFLEIFFFWKLWKIVWHYEKKGGFAIGLAIQFLNCKGHLKLTIFIHHEC